ncbi:MAG: thiolase family protein [Pseudomonadota bacterium]
MITEICFAAGRRTPLGNYGGALQGTALTDMAGHAARATVAASGIAPEAFDHMVFTTTVPTDKDTLFAARVVGMKSGIPEDAGALDVVRACGSGLQAILSAGQQITSGHSRIALAGGAECYSRVPHAVTKARWGQARGAMALEDVLDWAYRCPFSLEYMGETAENLAEDFQYQRDDMDEWGAMSQARALAAIESGFLSRQITPIDVKSGRAMRSFDTDESPRADATLEKLQRLKPAFREGGKVTAGNASGVTDGAGFVVVGGRDALEAEGCAPDARIVDWHVVGVPPRIMGHGPVPAIRGLLDKTGLRISDIDYFEINEAFAVVNLHAEAQLGVPRDIHNSYGGGISVGHPPGLTGVRMAMTAAAHLADTGGKRAVLSMCLGAGQGMAVLIERP